MDDQGRVAEPVLSSNGIASAASVHSEPTRDSIDSVIGTMTTATLSRRTIPKAAAALLMALALGPVTATASEELRAVELTFLKSNPGEREQLKNFIVLNWFAMDKIAKEQGLMSAFTVMDTGTHDGPWNVLVSVTYTDEKGYEGVADAFEKIRRSHTTVRVDGKALRDLGSIVDSKRLLENPAHAAQ